MTKLSRSSVTGKLINCDNLSGKLLRCGCCPSCETNVSSPCPAVYKWNIPKTIHVDLSGISLAQEQGYGTCHYGAGYGDPTCDDNCQYYCLTLGGGTLGGSYEIEVDPQWNYDHDAYICGGGVTVENAIYRIVHRYGIVYPDTEPSCTSVYDEGLVDVSVGVGIRAYQDASEEWVYEINCTVTVEGGGTVFRAASEPYPMFPEENRHGYEVTLQNTIEDTYDPAPVGECNVITSVPGWGGSVDISASGLHPFHVWIKEFGGTEAVGEMILVGNCSVGNCYVGAYLDLDDSELPHSTNLIVEYKVTYGGGLVETFRKCVSSGGYSFLNKQRELGQHLGYTTIEITNIYSPEIPNLGWDKSRGLAGFAWGNFDIPDNVLYVNSFTPLAEDDGCLPCSYDKCYTAMCQVQLATDPDGTSAEGAVVSYDWRKDDGSWVGGGQAVVSAGGQATLVTTDCVGIDLVNPSVPFVVEFRVTNISKDEYLYKPELNHISTCVCGPIIPPPNCNTLSPPTPNPAEHATNTPYRTTYDGPWYVVCEAVQPTSEPPTEDGYEFFFECIEDSGFNSGWRSADSVAGLYEPTGIPEVPHRYWAACDTSYTFQIKVRDVECQKETDFSDVRGIVNP